jgi:EAL domain-containing protein (putative c-di-GMP-specific phosphodiesterase class I)
VCRQAATWQTGHSADSQPEVSVNVHPNRLQTPAFLDEVATAIKETAIHPSRLTLELAEGQLMAQPDVSMRNLKLISELGVQLSLDSFGMGRSSLGCLAGLPVNALKIDQSFVHRLAEGNGHSKVVRGIVTLAHDLGMRVIAGGIETRPQFQMTSRELGIDWGQGLFIAPPVEPEAASQLLTANLDRGPSWECEEEALDGQIASPSTARGLQRSGGLRGDAGGIPAWEEETRWDS